MSPDYKDKLATQIESNFLTLEERIMKDIVRRIYKEGKITSTADYQINRLLTLGNSTEDIENMLKDALNASYPEMFELYDQVINWEYVRNKDIYEQINGYFIPYEENDYLKQLTEGLIRQTKGELENFTGSMGFCLNYNGKRILTPLAEVYQGYLNNAIMDIATGSFDYNTVLRRVVTELTNSGLRKIDYASGRAYRANVAARMSVMTGISQLTAHISDYNAEKLGTQYFEVAWHSGARPTHQAWQGKVYTKEELRTVCGLGTATGLLGVNCYHEYYPFFPGISERNWTDEWLKQHNEAENTPRNWKGKDYTLYEAKQRQREMERVMRAQREKVDLLKHGHADPDEIMLERCKYQAQLDEYSRFSKKMKLEQERARIYLDMKGRVAPRNGYFANKGGITEKWNNLKVESKIKSDIQYRTRYSKEEINIVRNDEKIFVRKIEGSKNIFVAKDLELTKFEASNASKAVDEAYKLIYGNEIKHKPDIYILKSKSFIGRTTGGYRAGDNSLFLNEAIFKKETLNSFTDEYVFGGDARSHIIHELVHVQQHEEAMKAFNGNIKTAKNFEEYKLLRESLAKEKIDNLLNQGYNCDVSKYAKESYKNKKYTEVIAEIYTFISLKR